MDGSVIEATNENVTYIRKDGQILDYYGTMWWDGELIFSDLSSSLATTFGAVGRTSGLTTLNDPVQSGFVIYPNPNRGVFSIISEQLQSVQRLEVLDDLGRIVFQKDLVGYNGNTLEINLSDQPDALYLLRFLSMDQSFVLRILKQP